MRGIRKQYQVIVMAGFAQSTRETGLSGHSARARRGSVWRWPILLAMVTIFGLLSALLGQGGVWWVLSWIALATPLAVTARYLWRRSP